MYFFLHLLPHTYTLFTHNPIFRLKDFLLLGELIVSVGKPFSFLTAEVHSRDTTSGEVNKKSSGGQRKLEARRWKRN